MAFEKLDISKPRNLKYKTHGIVFLLYFIP